MRPIEINGNKAPEPGVGISSTGTPGIRAALHVPVPTVANSNYILLETTGPLDGPEKQALVDLGVVLLEYVGDEVYLCGFKPSNLEELVQSLDFVVDAEVYNPAFVVESGLNEDPQAGDGSDDPTEVEIALHDDVDDEASGSVREAIAAKAGLSPNDVELADGKARIKVSKSKLLDIAQIDEVKTINKSHTRHLFNNVAGTILEVHKPVGLNHDIYKGKGQIVCVADTGFDTGNKDSCHEAFQDRVIATIGLGRRGQSDDPDGHGTHVSGSVLGKGRHSDPEQGSIEAPASQAKLIVQSLFDKWHKRGEHPSDWDAGLGGIPDTWPKLFDPPFQQGARIHTNSYGGSPSPYQDAETGKLDLYLRQKKKLIVLFAAGNDGQDTDSNPGHIDPYSLGAEAVAKNTITVGASENERKNVVYPENRGQPLTWGVWRRDYPSAPIKNDRVADNREGLAAFSSRGPSKPDGRIKPDVVAPGTTILSTRSSAIYDGHYSEFWGRSTDPKWAYSGGTSMACPLVAGCCAVIRGALVDNGTADPSAALVKAVLINGAVPLKGQYGQKLPNGEFTNTTLTPAQQALHQPDGPNPHSGFGRVNLNNSLQNVVPGVKGVVAGFGDKDGDQALGRDGQRPKEASFDIVVPESGSSQTLKVTLVYDDMPGERLQNDLNLVVKDSTGKEKHGNMGDAAGFDRVNNVEQVVWKDAKPGTYKVTITAYRTTHDPQSYAYAWRVFSPVV